MVVAARLDGKQRADVQEVEALRRRCDELEQRLEQLRDARAMRAEKIDSLGVMAGGIAHHFNNCFSQSGVLRDHGP